MLIPEKCGKCNLNSDERFKKCKDCPYVNQCEICGKGYETYAIILDCNPLSVASFLEEETKEDGTIRNICESCRNKLKENSEQYTC